MTGPRLTGRTSEQLLDQRGADIKAMFASISKTYDFLNHLLSLNFDKRWRRFAAGLSDVREDSKVLDVCAGTGDLAMAYSEHVGSAGRVIATDFCHEMLTLGQRKMRRSDNDKAILLVEADTLSLPFPTNTFDVVAVAFGIRNVEDLHRGIEEMARVARPGGRVVILEFSAPRNPLFRGAYHLYFSRILPLIVKLISRSEVGAYIYLPASVISFSTDVQLEEIMRECGLSEITVQQQTVGIVTVHVATRTRL